MAAVSGNVLTQEEVNFLIHHGCQADEIYDARLESGRVWKDNAGRQGFDLVLGSKCEKYGHRIRTRAGHCAQCDTSRISHVQSHNRPGIVYVAASRKLMLFKVGHALDREQRERNLNNQATANVADWKIIASAYVANRGMTEKSVLTALKAYQVLTPYQKDGREQVSRELLNASLRVVLKSYVRAIKNDSCSQLWKIHNIEQYDW